MGIDVNELQDHGEDLARFLVRYGAGLYVGEKDYKMRWPGTTTTVSGPLMFCVSMPEGSVLSVMSSRKEDQIASARRSAEIIIDNLQGAKLAGAIIFDCVVRGVILQDDFHGAVDAMKEVLQVPVIGFETYGEFAMEMGQMTGHHNATTVILAIPD